MACCMCDQLSSACQSQGYPSPTQPCRSGSSPGPSYSPSPGLKAETGAAILVITRLIAGQDEAFAPQNEDALVGSRYCPPLHSLAISLALALALALALSGLGILVLYGRVENAPMISALPPLILRECRVGGRGERAGGGKAYE